MFLKVGAQEGKVSLPVAGKWKVVKALNVGTVSCLEENRLVSFIGRSITYSKSRITVEGKHYRVDRYSSNVVPSDDFVGIFGFEPRLIPLKTPKIQIVNVELLDKGSDGLESASVIVKGSDEIILDWYCTYFLARRVK